MIYDYGKCKAKYKSDYRIKKAIAERKLFKIEPGVYSDREYEMELAVISAKYPKAIFTSRSAFYYLGLTTTIPEKYYLATDKDASKIRDKRVHQVFDNSGEAELGVVVTEVEGISIKIYGYERMLIELLRNKHNLPFDYYKEIIRSYRKRLDKLDITLIQDMAEQMPKSELILTALDMEVF